MCNSIVIDFKSSRIICAHDGLYAQRFVSIPRRVDLFMRRVCKGDTFIWIAKWWKGGSCRHCRPVSPSSPSQAPFLAWALIHE